jgi:hypothetical protein
LLHTEGLFPQEKDTGTERPEAHRWKNCSKTRPEAGKRLQKSVAEAALFCVSAFKPLEMKIDVVLRDER